MKLTSVFVFLSVYDYSLHFAKKPLILKKNHFAAELGDYDPDVHTPGTVSEFRFVPNQTEDMEIDVFEKYKDCV